MGKLIAKVSSELHLGAHTFGVVFDRSIRDDGNQGVLMRRRQKIVVDPTLLGSAKTEALFHEASHWICEVWNLDIAEADVGRLSEGLAEFFVRNFGLEFDWSGIKEVTSD